MSRADEIIEEWERLTAVAPPARVRSRRTSIQWFQLTAAGLVVIVLSAAALWTAAVWLAPAAILPAAQGTTQASGAPGNPAGTATVPAGSPAPTSRPHETGTNIPSAPPSLASSIGFVNGLPALIDGEIVETTAQAVATDSSSSDGRAVLVAGWLYGAEYACGVPTNAWDPCPAMHLYAARIGGAFMPVFVRSVQPVVGPVGPGDAEAIVVRVHTHDASCKPADDCLYLPVLDEVVFLGSVAPPGATDLLPPSNGVSRSRAISLAESSLDGGALGFTLQSATLGPYGIIGGGGTVADSDRWVWAITFSTQPAASCTPGAGGSPAPCSPGAVVDLVVLDDIEGVVLTAVTVGSPTP